MRTSGVQCCLVGAILASVSWAVVFMLYQNIDSFQFNSNEPRMLKLVARHQAVAPSLPVANKPHRYTEPDRNGNRPETFFGKPKKVKAVHNSINLEVIEGQLTDELTASRIDTEADQQQHDRGFKQHSFNEYLSNKLTFHRSVPDTRDPRCEGLQYNIPALPHVSVVMCFYNEALSVLLRALHSIFDRTDQSLLTEVILVDDYSTNEDLKEKLDNYISQAFGNSVKLIRNGDREGLIRSRMIGARVATSKVLVFLDSHIEVNVGWLPPLVERVAMSQMSVVLPIIDIIDSNTFTYKSSPLVRGGFTWSMRFSWEQIPSTILEAQPLYVSSPTMAGGLLAVDREFFFKLGGYDEGMDIWGGENIEMSLRVWMCGGQIEIAVCSRVGHIFRKTRPYSAPNGEDTMTKNTLRMVKVWLGDSQDRFYDAVGNRFSSFDYGDVTDRVELRNNLKCRDFGWYLDNVYNPDKRVHTVKQQAPVKVADHPEIQQLKKNNDRKMSVGILNVINKGRLKLAGTKLCVEPDHGIGEKITPNSDIIVSDCSTIKNKWYEVSDGGYLIGKNQCLDVMGSQRVTVSKCTGQGGSQQWILQTKPELQDGSGLLFNPSSGLCLHVPSSPSQGSQVTLSLCDDAAKFIYLAKSNKQ